MNISFLAPSQIYRMEIEGNGIEFSGEIRGTATFRVDFETL